jgi:phospholipid/cholesterol/gamma-HCH transport system substrate-binding protein/paraquat-inducible protein B
MSRNTSYLKVGIFALAAFAVLAAGLVFFGLSQAFQPVLECATYFDHSVQGLGNGSAVSFRGFHVGQVTSISVADANSVPGHRTEAVPKKLVKVTFIVTPALITGNPSSDLDEALNFILVEMSTGLRCFFSFQGVSGISNLNLDYLDLAPPLKASEPDPYGPVGPMPGAPPPATPPAGLSEGLALALQDPIHTRGGVYDGMLYIPSAPGSIMELGESLNQILRSLKEVDFRKISMETTSLLRNLNEISAGLNRETGGFSEELVEALGEVKRAANNMSSLASSIQREIDAFSRGSGQFGQLEGALSDARRTLNRLDSVLRIPQSTLPSTMENLRVMSENLRTLSETARDYPSSIILGSPPPPME